jgi:GTP-binding protein EngB required for normal cell division
VNRRPEPGVAVASLANAVELAGGRLDPELVAAAGEVVGRSQGRLRHGTSRTVVALLGPTGGGKSSLLNALAGDQVSEPGVRRPTTDHTVAAVWGDEDPGDLLGWLGVTRWHRVEGAGGELDGLVLLDVPDHDSLALEHRVEMERIADHADLLVWVTDAEKYADRSLHRYLRELVGRDPLVMVALNKADLLEGEALAACRSDLARLLVADGLPGATVVAVSARTGAGVAELRSQLARAVRARRAATERILAEVRVAAQALAGQVHLDRRSGGLGERGRRDLLDGLADAAGAAAVEQAVAAGYRRDAHSHVGWPVTRWVGRLRPHPLRRLRLDQGSAGRSSRPAAPAGEQARALATIRAAAERAGDELPEPWPSILRRRVDPDPATLHDRLDQAVAGPVRAPVRRPRWWRAVGALQAALALAAAAGAVWLAALAVLAWLALPPPPVPRVGAAPVPTVALLGGLAGGWLLAVAGRRLAARGARRRAAAARAGIRRQLEQVAQDLVIGPLDDELRRRDALVSALRAAGAGSAGRR